MEHTHDSSSGRLIWFLSIRWALSCIQEAVSLVIFQMFGYFSDSTVGGVCCLGFLLVNMAAVSAPKLIAWGKGVSHFLSYTILGHISFTECVYAETSYTHSLQKKKKKSLGTESKRAFLWSGCKERCLCPARLAEPVLHPPQLCPLGYYTFTTQSALSKRSCSNPRKSRLHWRKWLCSVHKC